MDSDFTFGRVVHEVHMQVREAQYARRESDFLHSKPKAEEVSRSVLVKSYFSSDISVADRLLKKVIPYINSQYSNCAKLVEVIFEPINPESPDFSVNYVLELLGDVDEETVTRDDSFALTRKDFDGYTFGQMIENNEAASVYEATSAVFPQPLAIKKFVFPTLHELNRAIRESIRQVQVQHENTCRLLDMTLRREAACYEFGLVMERMPRSLKKDIQLHLSTSTQYPEGEMRRFLQEVGRALLHAKKQNTAHCNIKPENVLISQTNKFVLSDFGSSWKRSDTFGYMAPEVRDTSKKSFPADIYSLGMTALSMGMLNDQLHESEENVQAKISELQYSDEVRALLGRMTHHNPTSRPLLEEVISALKTATPLPYLDCYDWVMRKEKNEKEVKMYDIELNTWGTAIRVKGELKADHITSYLMVDAGRLFCCGNWNCTMHLDASKETYVVHLESGEVEELSLMKCPRRAPGLLQFQGDVFAFGSSTAVEAGAVEVFASNSWTLLPYMTQDRWSFTPCEHQGNAYLFSSNMPIYIDIFDLATRTFLNPISVHLEKESSGAVCAVVGDVLIIFSGTYNAKVDLKTRSRPRVSKHAQIELYPRSSAVMVGEWLYWVNAKGRAMRGGERVELLS